MNIIDKEVLTFSNLTNLKIENANLISKYISKFTIDEKTNQKTEVIIPQYHTIYSLYSC